MVPIYYHLNIPGEVNNRYPRRLAPVKWLMWCLNVVKAIAEGSAVSLAFTLTEKGNTDVQTP